MPCNSSILSLTTTLCNTPLFCLLANVSILSQSTDLLPTASRCYHTIYTRRKRLFRSRNSLVREIGPFHRRRFSMFVNNQNRHQWQCYEVTKPHGDHKWVWRQGCLTQRERTNRRTTDWWTDRRTRGWTSTHRWTDKQTNRQTTDREDGQTAVKTAADTNYPRVNFFRRAKPFKHLHHTKLGGNSATAKKKVTAWFSLGDFSLKILMELSDVIPLPFNCSSL